MPEDKMMSERMISWAPVVGVLVSGAFIATVVPTPLLFTLVMLVTIAAAIALGLRARQR